MRQTRMLRSLVVVVCCWAFTRADSRDHSITGDGQWLRAVPKTPYDHRTRDAVLDVRDHGLATAELHEQLSADVRPGPRRTHALILRCTLQLMLTMPSRACGCRSCSGWARRMQNDSGMPNLSRTSIWTTSSPRRSCTVFRGSFRRSNPRMRCTSAAIRAA